MNDKGLFFLIGDIDGVFDTVGFDIKEWENWGTYDEYVDRVEEENMSPALLKILHADSTVRNDQLELLRYGVTGE